MLTSSAALFAAAPFPQGLWLGIELSTPEGKNDGEVKGRRYFRCEPSYGLFVRPRQCTALDSQAAVKLVSRSKPKAALGQMGKNLLHNGIQSDSDSDGGFD